jgi:hypothetical protein
MQRKSWPTTFKMLDGVDYTQLNSDGSFLILEAAVEQNLFECIVSLQPRLSEASLLATTRLMIGYLSSYLGFFVMATLGETKAAELRPDIQDLIGMQSDYVYDLLAKYPLHLGAEKTAIENLNKLRNTTPGFIVDRTLNLCEAIDKVMNALEANYKESKKPRLLSSLDSFFIPWVRAAVEKNIEQNKKNDVSNQIIYVINQTAVQIGWLIGHYSCLESKGRYTILDYMLYVMPSLDRYIAIK